MPEDLRDDVLIARCLEHDEDAWRLLIGRYTSYVYTIAIRGYDIDAEEAGDVAQETFLRLFEGLPSYRGDGEFRAWLRQLVRNCCVTHLRRRRTGRPLDETLCDPVQEEMLARIERAFVLSDALRGLEPPCRQLISLFFFQGQSYKNIALALAIPEGTVASRLARCLVKLRPKVGEPS